MTKEIEVVVVCRQDGTAKIDWEATTDRWEKNGVTYDTDKGEWDEDTEEPEWFGTMALVIENILPRSKS